MSLMCREILNFIEEKYPLNLAEDYDNVGLLIGRRDKKINKILVCLEVTDSVVREAVELKADMIISHHPLIFKPIRRITDRENNSTIITNIIKNDINLYSLHTNFDNASNGMNDILARALNLINIEILSENKNRKLYKIAVFIPSSHESIVKNAMLEAGAGFIGNYSHCSFSTSGTGTFKPLTGASPFIGEVGSLELVQEIKVETIVEGEKLSMVIEAMLKAHPYEEVAYDIFKLENEMHFGTGRAGELEKPLEFEKFCSIVKEKLNIKNLNVVGELDKMVRKVAVVGGAGDQFIQDSINAGCDVLLTGDIKHHIALDALAAGINIIDAGHYGTEVHFVPFIAELIKDGLMVDSIESNIITNPFALI